MKKHIFPFFIVLLVLVIQSSPIFSKSNELISWLYDIDEAFEAAKHENKLIMMYVYTDWSIPEEDTVFTDYGISDMTYNFICLEVNPESSTEINDFCSGYAITEYPAVLFLNAEGTFINGVDGIDDASVLYDTMYYSLIEGVEIPDAYKRFKNGDTDSGIYLLNFYFDNAQYDSAESILIELDADYDLNRQDIFYYYNVLGYSYFNNGDSVKALTIFESSYAMFTPEDGLYQHNFAAYYIGHIMYQSAQPFKAVDFFSFYMENNEIDPGIKYYFDTIINSAGGSNNGGY